jgi:hypothetical protein
MLGETVTVSARTVTVHRSLVDFSITDNIMCPVSQREDRARDHHFPISIAFLQCYLYFVLLGQFGGSKYH